MMLDQELLNMALKSDDGLAKLKELREMEKEYNAEQAMKSYRIAMSKLQDAMPVIKKLKVNEHNKSFYASLDDIVLQMQPYLGEFGFSFQWKQKILDNGIIVVNCLAHHVDGHTESCVLQSPHDTTGTRGVANKTVIQGCTSTVTYLRRYTYTGVFGIATADHDIDGRIEGVTERQITKSESLNFLLNNKSQAMLGPASAIGSGKGITIEDMLIGAQNMEELEAAATMISSVQNDDDRTHLNHLYNQTKETYIHG